MAEERNERRKGRAATGGIDALLERIAKQYLDIETLETRKSDSLDFHDVAVWGVRKALKAAYDAGRQSARPPKPPKPQPPSVN